MRPAPRGSVDEFLRCDMVYPMLLQHEMMPTFGGQEAMPSPFERALAPHEQVQVDLNTPLVDSKEMSIRLGILGDLVATVDAGSKSFLIVDTRTIGSNRDFLIADETCSKASKTGFKGVLEDEPVVIGRGHYSNRFSYPDTVSREHFEVLYTNNSLFIRNLRPMNTTTVTAHLVQEQQSQELSLPDGVDDMRTFYVEDRMQAHPNFRERDETAPYGYYMNHPIIGRASKSVDGGVYLGGSAREAIVVDGKSVAMENAYKDITSELRELFERSETLPIQSILVKVMHKVQEVMPYDGRKAEAIGWYHHGDKLIGLSTYIKERAGVCRHQGLLAAYIIENLIKDSYMLGTVGVERNTVEDRGGTHAWAVYKKGPNGAGGVIVIDPAQSFVGTKAQALRGGRWEYRLSTDEY